MKEEKELSKEELEEKERYEEHLLQQRQEFRFYRKHIKRIGNRRYIKNGVLLVK